MGEGRRKGKVADVGWTCSKDDFLQVSQAGLLTAFIPTQLLRLYQLLLFTLPGTPVFSYGDEIGLQAALLSGQVPLVFCSAQCGK